MSSGLKAQKGTESLKRIVASVLITMMVLGAVYGAAAAISTSGVDKLLGDSEVINNLACPICTTVPTPTPVP